MIHHLHEFATPFTLYLNVANAQNPVRKHFDKTNTMKILYVPKVILGHPKIKVVEEETYLGCIINTDQTDMITLLVSKR